MQYIDGFKCVTYSKDKLRDIQEEWCQFMVSLKVIWYFYDKVGFMFLNIFARSGSCVNLYNLALICTHDQ